jgi:hypothetical protein
MPGGKRVSNMNTSLSEVVRDLMHREVTLPTAIQALRNSAEANFASEFYDYLMLYISSFESRLDEAFDVGVCLVSFGASVQFYLESMGFANPSLISFNGRDVDGKPLTLVQHVTQINLLLTTLPRAHPEEPRRPIGFRPVEEVPK